MSSEGCTNWCIGFSLFVKMFPEKQQQEMVAPSLCHFKTFSVLFVVRRSELTPRLSDSEYGAGTVSDRDQGMSIPPMEVGFAWCIPQLMAGELNGQETSTMAQGTACSKCTEKIRRLHRGSRGGSLPARQGTLRDQGATEHL